MTPEETIQAIDDWMQEWGDIDVSDLDIPTLWAELNAFLRPPPPLIAKVEGNVLVGPWNELQDDGSVHEIITSTPPKPLPGRWSE